MNNIIKKENAQPATFGSVVDQIFQNNLSRFFDDSFWGGNQAMTRNQVPVNIRETEKSYEIALIAPGLKKSDFQLQVTADLLTISFEHAEENKQDNQNWLRQEYRKQSFQRSFSLDDSVDASKATARYEDGVLHLVLPKKEGARATSRTISVQ
jgi:HSP20 family protein